MGLSGSGELILVTGGRDYSDYERVLLTLDKYVDHEAQIIHGDAPGADALAQAAAMTLGLPVTAYPADWDRHGKAAGPIRNRQMLDEKPDLVIAFPGGKGTADCVGEARRRGIPVLEIV